MITGKTTPLTALLGGDAERPELFIGSVSFENRCTAGAFQVFRRFGANTQYVFLDYSYIPPIKSIRLGDKLEQMRLTRLQMQSENRQIISDELGDSATFVEATIENPLKDYLSEIRRFAAGLDHGPMERGTVWIDISTFTKPIMGLMLSTLLRDRSCKRLYVLNTKPLMYSQSHLSLNIALINMMPGFNGQWHPNKSNVLIAILGFEGHKLASVLGNWTFRHVVPILGFPAFAPGLHDRSLLGNADQLRQIGAMEALQYAPASDPFMAYKIMTSIADSHDDDYNVAITPLGPKPLALAAIILAIERNYRLLYCFPQEYYADYSQDAAETHCYKMVIS